MMYRKIIASIASAFFMVLLIGPAYVYANANSTSASANNADSQIRQKADELNALKRQKQEVEKKRQMAIEAERSVAKSLKAINRELSRRERELKNYEGKLDSESRKLNAIQFRINDLSFQAAQQKSNMNLRLRDFYKMSYQSSYLSRLGLSKIKNHHELSVEKQYFNSIVSSDEQYLERLRVAKAILHDNKVDLEQNRNLLISYRNRVSQEKSKILHDKSKRQVLLVEYKNQKESYTRTLEQLERSVVQLEALISKLGSVQKSPDQRDFQLSTLSLNELGILSWPIVGRVIRNAIPALRGITIQADYGDEIKSIYDGIVEYSGWFDAVGLGQIVIINHGHNYRSVYAHLSEILVRQGGRVKRDQMIGRVGNIGDSNRSALYFEIRSGSSTVDARRWLK